MLVSVVDQILKVMRIGGAQRDARHAFLMRMRPDERERYLQALARRQKRVRRFIEDEAIECDEIEVEPKAEVGYRYMHDDLAPRDSKGRRYVKFVSSRLIFYYVRSPEFRTLSRSRRRSVLRRARVHARICLVAGRRL